VLPTAINVIGKAIMTNLRNGVYFMAGYSLFRLVHGAKHTLQIYLFFIFKSYFN